MVGIGQTIKVYASAAGQRVANIFVVRNEEDEKVVLQLKTAQKIALIVLTVILGYFVVGPAAIICFVLGASYGSSQRLQEFVNGLFTCRISRPPEAEEPSTPRQSSEKGTQGLTGLYRDIGDSIAGLGTKLTPKAKK